MCFAFAERVLLSRKCVGFQGLASRLSVGSMGREAVYWPVIQLFRSRRRQRSEQNGNVGTLMWGRKVLHMGQRKTVPSLPSGLGGGGLGVPGIFPHIAPALAGIYLAFFAGVDGVDVAAAGAAGAAAGVDSDLVSVLADSVFGASFLAADL